MKVNVVDIVEEYVVRSPGLQLERALFAADGEGVRDILLGILLNLQTNERT